jgi:methylmalonyl-CoA/ethylmalonyl-CoA epimerase
MTDGTPFTNLHHICIVVRDIDKATKFYESVGIGPWEEYGSLEQYTDLDVPDRDGFFATTYRYTQVGSIQVQLCQPGDGNNPQRRFLEERGEGVFHIGFEVDDIDDARERGIAAGLEVLMRGGRDDGSGFAYFDTADRAGGVVLETRQSPLA